MGYNVRRKQALFWICILARTEGERRPWRTQSQLSSVSTLL